MKRRPLKNAGYAVVGLYLLFALCALLFSEQMLFVPREPGYDRLPNQVRIATADNEQITAVYLRHPNARYTILFSHGNREDLSTVAPFMERFYRLGYSVLMYDYRGYGTSDGTPSSVKARQDAAAAYKWLTESQRIAPETIIAHGRSLGGSLAVWLAATHEVGALVIESTFASAFRVKTHWKLLPWDKFDSLSLIARVHCPVLVMHGTEDEVIPFWHGKKLYDAAPEPKQHLWITNGRHHDYAYAAGDQYLAVFEDFIKSVPAYFPTDTLK